MKKLLAALTVALLATVSISAHAKDWTTIRFGVDASYPPFESKGADGKLVGFDIDLGNEICARLKAKCVWVENDFDGMIPALKAKKFDGVLSSMSNWEPKGAKVVPYQNQDQVYADLISGRLDAALQDAVQAEIGFLKTPRGAGFEFVGKDLEDKKILGEGAGIGMRKEDTDLKAKVDKAIADIIKDGTYKKIEKKYFDFDVYGG